MEMHQVRYFLALAETRNFTRAAEMRQVTQPALTRAIKLLEQELGGQLLDRSATNIHPTDLGTVMLPQFKRMRINMGSVRTTAASLLNLKNDVDTSPSPLGWGLASRPRRH